MKQRIIHSILSGLALLLTTGCSDWLEVMPQNDQTSDAYWQNQEEVDAMVTSGYLYLREMVVDYLIPYGELRSGQVYSIKTNKLQNFQVKPTDEKLCDWGPFYQIINVANTVLSNAHKAMANDRTYKVEEMNAHFCEAYFLRALSYFYLVRNWREVPLITVPFEDDSYSYHVPKASEDSIVAQIKADVRAALATGAAKEHYETTWETKGRATRWALYALMADVCLWSEDYATAITFCDYLLKATSPHAPVLLSTPNHATWFSMFNPGNSNESILELQWDYQEKQTNTLPVLFDNTATSRLYQLSPQMLLDFNNEYGYTVENLLEAVRTMYGGYYTDDPNAWEVATSGYVWKYCGSRTLSDKRTQTYYDPNFILYRMADVYLMKAEALILRSNNPDDWDEAAALINAIRQRSNLEPIDDVSDKSEQELLAIVLHERRMELVGEGKSWYDVLRFGRRANNKYKAIFLDDLVTTYNKQAGESWLLSVLSNDNALFLPVSESELEANKLLEQNLYYY